MRTSSKHGSASLGTRAARGFSEPSRLASKPFLRFYFSESLRRKTLSTLTTLEHALDATAHRDALADVVVELTHSGMDYYFMRPLKLAKAGFIVQKSAHLGLAGVLQVMASATRNVIGRMDRPQLLSVCGFIRKLMH